MPRSGRGLACKRLLWPDGGECRLWLRAAAAAGIRRHTKVGMLMNFARQQSRTLQPRAVHCLCLPHPRTRVVATAGRCDCAVSSAGCPLKLQKGGAGRRGGRGSLAVCLNATVTHRVGVTRSCERGCCAAQRPRRAACGNACQSPLRTQANRRPTLARAAVCRSAHSKTYLPSLTAQLPCARAQQVRGTN